MKKIDISKIILNILFLASFILLIFPIFQSRVLEKQDSVEEIKKFETLLSLEDTTDPSTFSIAESENKIVGVIYIPSIDIKLPIYDSITEYSLSKGVGLLQSYNNISGDKDTHSVLSSHNGLSASGLFTNLNKLVEGDKFYIKNSSGKINEYEVNKIELVYPYEIEKLQIQDENFGLSTLLTCESIEGLNSHRRLVTGKNLGEAKEEIIKKENKIILSNYEIFAICTISVVTIIIVTMRLRRKHEENSKPN